MNLWACSTSNEPPTEDELYTFEAKETTKLILMGEAWAINPGGDGFFYVGATIGARGNNANLPGRRFSDLANNKLGSTRYGGVLPTEVRYTPQQSDGNHQINNEKANWALADGHVELRDKSELYVPGTFKKHLSTALVVRSRSHRESSGFVILVLAPIRF